MTVVNDIVTQFDKTLNGYYKTANGLKSSFLPYWKHYVFVCKGAVCFCSWDRIFFFV